MKILHTADWHIGEFPGPEWQGINRRLMDTGECLSHLHSVAMEEKPDLILVCGDIFHSAQVWVNRGIDETMRAISAIEALAEIAPVVVLRGTPNHDGDKQFEMLKTYFSSEAYGGEVYVVTEPKAFEVQTLINGPVQVAALPGFDRGVFRAKFPGLSREEENRAFTEELGKTVLGLRAMCDDCDAPAVFISHYTVPGCNMESGQTQFFSGVEPVILPEVLDAAGFDLVTLGHIHRPQRLESCRNAFYSGAINALNFNDEGQERGFWIHELQGPLCQPNPWESKFIKTPYRQFVTIWLEDEEIAMLNSGNPVDADTVAHYRWRGQISDKIVRVIYTCTEENHKALVPAALEKMLYDDGAFWVAEILPDKVYPVVNRKGLSEKTDPESNLIQYLMDKKYPQEEIRPILELAQPIISRATSSGTNARFTGVFEPVSIEVKNYRNYAEECFDFADISFCTINGKNGAGKSSLFMDAILDCLYEEPREGDLVGWIRADEAARSGSIMFTFRIGPRTFRVTRTRTKSGKATLNLSELKDGEWQNRSKEKIRDTQEEIVNVLGMDSLTFRSCALIMQDQYGLFLEADKESRMTILGNILGLGIYGDMELMARDESAAVHREMTKRQTIIKAQLEQIKPGDNLRRRLDEVNELVRQETASLELMTSERDNAVALLAAKERAYEEAENLRIGVKQTCNKIDEVDARIGLQERVVNEAKQFLSNEATIHDGVAAYNALTLQERQMLSDIALYESKNNELQSLHREIVDYGATFSGLNNSRKKVVDVIERHQAELANEQALMESVQQHRVEKQRLDAMEQRATLYIQLSENISVQQRNFHQLQTAYNTAVITKAAKVRSLQEKMELLENSGCPDPDNATCKFLADARAAKAEYASYNNSFTQWEQEETAKLEEQQLQLIQLDRQREDIGYDANALELQRNKVRDLEAKARQYEELASVREEIARQKERLASLDETIAAEEKRHTGLRSRAQALSAELVPYQDITQRHAALLAEIEAAKHWLEDETQLPVMREKLAQATQRHAELSEELRQLVDDNESRKQRLSDSLQAAGGITQAREQLAAINNSIAETQNRLDTLRVETGSITQQLKQIEEFAAYNAQLQAQITEYAEQAARLDILKGAFSQDGIPHNIICSIVPTLTATANKILGQMTGGRMGMEFRTEKVLKSNKREVVTLDIFIEEYGKGALPYRSKSGGEKVKSALSAILALAEIKSTSAGIQLGMLFIDEPPFLDGDGVTAYCDALDTIRQRYSSLKVMAITHDPAMKARFPQSLDVIKTEEGSKVMIA